MKKFKVVFLIFALAMLVTLVPAASAAPPTAVACDSTYTVTAGDWLSKVSDKFLGSVTGYWAIASQTNKKNAEDSTFAKVYNVDVIEVGQKLCIPNKTDADAFLATFNPANAADVAALYGVKPPVGGGSTYRIFWSNQQVGHPFWNVVKQGFEDAAKHYGFQLDSAGPTKMDDAAQISMIEAAIASGQYDGMAIPAIVPDTYTPVINEAVAKGIKVVVFCCDAPQSKRAAFVGTSPFNAGQKAGQLMAKVTGGNAVINIITGKPDEADLVQRIAGFEDAIKAFPGMKVDSTDTGAGGLTENVSKLSARLISSPSVNAFFGAMAEGGPAVLTLLPTNQDRLKGTHTVTMDDLPQTLDGIRAGTIDGAVVQAQYNWGYGAIYELHRIIQKGLPPTADSTDTGTVSVTKDNVDTYGKETMNPKQWLDFEAAEPKAAAAPATTGKTYRIFWSNQQVGHPFWNIVKQGFEDAAKHYGFQLDSAGPTKMDDAAQISMIEAAIASGQYDGMAIPAIVPDTYAPVIDEAVAKGIKVVVFCCDAPKSKRAAFVGTSPFAAGQKAGQLMAKVTGGNAVINIITGKPDEADLVQRIAGFEDAIKAFPGMKVDSTDTGAGGLTENVSKLSARLISSPSANAFFGAMAEGGPAVLTLLPTNADRFKGTHTVTMDDLPQTLDGIRAGQIDGAIVQAQYNWGYGAIYELHRILQKNLPPTADSTDTGTVVVTKDNVDTYGAETMNPKQWLDFEAAEPK